MNVVLCQKEAIYLNDKSNMNGCIFSGTNRYFQRIATELGLEVGFADCTQPEKLKAALKPNTKVGEGESVI